MSDATPRTGVRHRRSGIAALDTKCIRAPMPGKIVKAFKKLGDQVTEGDTIIVLEALKMEYSLAAAQSGKIKKLEGKEGKQVSLGDLLVELSEEKTN